MAGVRQEIDRGGWEKKARLEVDGYIEKVEKGTEVVMDQGLGAVGKTNLPNSSKQTYVDMGQLVVQSLGGQQKAKVILPLTEEELKLGLHRKIVDGFRWLAEWCQMVIKKYPGRVFYPVRA
jgi:hypothetical protein